MVIKTSCVIHDAKEAQRYQEMGIDEAPPKQTVGFQFHMGDVKTLTQHILDEDDETELQELCLVNFYDGQTVPVAAPYTELAKKYQEYHRERDEKLKKAIQEKN